MLSQFIQINGVIFELHLPTVNVLLPQEIVLIVIVVKLLKRVDAICFTATVFEQIVGSNTVFDKDLIPNSLRLIGFDETSKVVSLFERKISQSSQPPIIFWFLIVNEG